MSYLIDKLLKNKDLLTFTILNYLDKFFLFSLPLLVLYISKNQQIYNDIEYIFSIAGIAVVFLDLGMGTYLFYGYKESDDRLNYIEKIRLYFGLSLFIYLIIGIVLLPFYLLYNEARILLPFIFVRTLYLLYLNFYSSYYRLKDHPSLIYWLSIPVNILSFLLILLFKDYSNLIIFCFFAPQFLLILIGIFYYLTTRQRILIIEFKHFFSKALTYSWPIFINVSIVSYINNFGKIYAYNFLSSDEMYQISYTLRISLIIQMAHSSIIAFYSKSIYEDKSYKINSAILKKYTLFLFTSLIMVFIFIITVNQMRFFTPITIKLANIFIVLYTILWCYKSYFEMYYGKYNENKMLLVLSIISSTFFTAYVLVLGIGSFLQLSIVMVMTSTISFILTIFYLKNNILAKLKLK